MPYSHLLKRTSAAGVLALVAAPVGVVVTSTPAAAATVTVTTTADSVNGCRWPAVPARGRDEANAAAGPDHDRARGRHHLRAVALRG